VPESQPVRVDRSAVAAELLEVGFVLLPAPHENKELAWSCARSVFHEAAREDAIGADMPPLGVVGHFTVPPPGAPRRDFQTLHMDFGLPVVPECPNDVARFTALYVDRDRAPTALTRVVSLRRLLSQRAWVEPELLLERLRTYGEMNARPEERRAGYVEGIFARLVEAADDSPTLPPSGDAGFLCGMEFASLAQERAHFAERGLDLDAVEQRVQLGPGQLLLLDNLATTHGRLGVRKPLELHQLCVGFPGLDVSRQSVLLHRVLRTFSSKSRPRTELAAQPHSAGAGGPLLGVGGETAAPAQPITSAAPHRA
jgi:hypothetical protein